MTVIQQTAENTFETKSGNTELKLSKGKWGWEVIANNPATRAYRTLGFKRFDNRAQVESHYKAFRGISALVAA